MIKLFVQYVKGLLRSERSFTNKLIFSLGKMKNIFSGDNWRFTALRLIDAHFRVIMGDSQHLDLLMHNSYLTQILFNYYPITLCSKLGTISKCAP